MIVWDGTAPDGEVFASGPGRPGWPHRALLPVLGSDAPPPQPADTDAGASTAVDRHHGEPQPALTTRSSASSESSDAGGNLSPRHPTP